VPDGIAFAHRQAAAVHVSNAVNLQASGGMINAGGLETELLGRLEASGPEAVDSGRSMIGGLTPELPGVTVVERTWTVRFRSPTAVCTALPRQLP
jgi:hypothetical protein